MRRRSVYELWVEAGGATPGEYDRDRFVALMREEGHIVSSGDEDASRVLPCGWPGEAAGTEPS